MSYQRPRNAHAAPAMTAASQRVALTTSLWTRPYDNLCGLDLDRLKQQYRKVPAAEVEAAWRAAVVKRMGEASA